MDAIIGRDGTTSQLNVAVNQKIYRFFTQGSVPTDVSRQHCIITTNDDGSYTIRNIKTSNATYVNGVEIEEMTVTDADRIELGRSRYLLNLRHIMGKILPQQNDLPEFDITPLQKIWDDYNDNDMRLQKRQKRVSLLASVPMGLSMLGGIVSTFDTTLRPYAVIFTIIALIVLSYGIYKRYSDDTSEKRQNLKIDFQLKYACPNPKCRHSLSNTPYPVLLNKGKCPYCKAKYKTPQERQP